jgi:hypothetical protein
MKTKTGAKNNQIGGDSVQQKIKEEEINIPLMVF